MLGHFPGYLAASPVHGILMFEILPSVAPARPWSHLRNNRRKSPKQSTLPAITEGSRHPSQRHIVLGNAKRARMILLVLLLLAVPRKTLGSAHRDAGRGRGNVGGRNLRPLGLHSSPPNQAKSDEA